MRQMYKVFINDSVLVFTDNPSAQSQKFTGKEQLEQLIAQLEDGSLQEVILQTENLEAAFEIFADSYTLIEAAGGLVFNAKVELLMIHRLGKWDLPKGKIEPREEIKTAAVREVEEECGISAPQIKRRLPNTYHTYRLKGKPILKRTYWFEMFYQGNESLIPQEEEDITTTKWCAALEVEQNLENTYGNIKALWQAVND